MNDKRQALESVLDKVGKLFAMLSSDNRDEAANAAAMMKEQLKKVGLDIHDLWRLGWVDNKENIAEVLANLFANKDSDLLVRIGLEHAKLFRNDQVFADVTINGRRHTYPVESSAFEKYLTHLFYRQRQATTSATAIKAAVRTLVAHAEFETTPRRTVHLRSAEHNGKLYIDLGNAQWQVVEVDASGWRVLNTAPDGLRFWRTPELQALPMPVNNGKIERLQEFANLDDDGMNLFIAILLDTFRERKHPVLNLTGEHGTAKSTLAKLLKKLTDPEEVTTRSMPDNVRDLFVAVKNARVLCFDNVSKIERRISDALCQISDGSGFGRRQLFSDVGEIRIQGSRTVILTGITNCITRPDLASRTINLTLRPISDSRRKSEREFWANFDRAHASILGGLLDALVYGLKHLSQVNLRSASRMADFEIWAHACEGAFAAQGDIAKALATNAVQINEAVLDEDAVATAIAAFMVDRNEWTGSATELMSTLKDLDSAGALMMKERGAVTTQKDWPPDATRFSGRLRAAAATLRKAGIDVTFGTTRQHNRSRTVTLRKNSKPAGTADAADVADAADADKSKGPGEPKKSMATAEKPASGDQNQSSDSQRPQRPQRPRSRGDRHVTAQVKETKFTRQHDGRRDAAK
jgi:hypothetical protein